ncbi:MAG: hypothetical protein WCF06_12805, partial [Nitrososphaeraceae archaeon]
MNSNHLIEEMMLTLVLFSQQCCLLFEVSFDSSNCDVIAIDNICMTNLINGKFRDMDNYSKFRYPTIGVHIYPNLCIPLYIVAICH